MARTQLNSREIATTWNKERKKWPPASLDRLIGPKAVIPIMVAPRSANWVLRTDLEAASAGVNPLLTPITIPSATTIPLSTSIPIAIINAPKEIRCSSIPAKDIIKIVPKTVSNRAAPTTVPARQPIKTHNAVITVSTDRIRFRKNSVIDSSTAVCCAYIVST